MGHLDELIKKAKENGTYKVPTTPNIEGFIWVNILVKYDLKGNAEIVMAFSKPAKDSTIKKFAKQKTKKPAVQKVEFDKSSAGSEDLF